MEVLSRLLIRECVGVSDEVFLAVAAEKQTLGSGTRRIASGLPFSSVPTFEVTPPGTFLAVTGASFVLEAANSDV